MKFTVSFQGRSLGYLYLYKFKSHKAARGQVNFQVDKTILMTDLHNIPNVTFSYHDTEFFPDGELAPTSDTS